MKYIHIMQYIVKLVDNIFPQHTTQRIKRQHIDSMQ